MKLTIIVEDSAVYVDGTCFSELDLTNAPSDIHALQWKDSSGWIEFKDNVDGTKPQNQSITELPNWANEAKVKWDNAKNAYDAAILTEQKAAEEAAANQPKTQGIQTA